MPKKRYLETGAAVKPEASMPNVTKQRMRKGGSIAEKKDEGQYSKFSNDWEYTSSHSLSCHHFDCCRKVLLYNFPSRAVD